MLRRITDLLSNSVPRPASLDWAEVERLLGTALPGDYRNWCKTFPLVYLNEYLMVLHPLNGVDNVRAHIDFAHRWSAGRSDRFPFDLYPVPGGLLGWAFTDDGAQCWWRTDGHPDEWTVVVTDRMEAPYWEFNGGMVDFIASVLEEKVVCPIFTEDFPRAYPDEPIKVTLVGQ